MRTAVVGLGVLAVAVFSAWLVYTDGAIDRQRNDAVVRVLQLDQQLDVVRKNARAVKQVADAIKALPRRPRAGAAMKALADDTDAFRVASRALLESYSALGLYAGDVRAARQSATSVVSLLTDAVWLYGRSPVDGDRAFARARLALDNFNDAAADLWRAALARRNQPLDEARRLSKPFPLAMFDRPQIPPNRNDSPDQRRETR